MELFKKKSLSLSLLLIIGLALVSCADKTADSVLPTPTPESSLAINSDKKVTEDYTAHQMVVNISSNVDFKFAVKDGDDWITPDSTENSHAKGDSVKIAFNLKENKSLVDRSTVLLFATADSKEFTDTVHVTQNSLSHLVINSEKEVTEKPTAHQITVDVSSSMDFKFAVKDGDDWITPQDAEKTHAKGDSVKITFNLKENKSLVDRSTVLLFATADSKEFTDTVHVTQNTLSHLAINSDKKVTEDHTAHKITVDVSSSMDFKFAVKDGDDWITPENAEKTHAKGDNVKIAFNLKENKSIADRSTMLLFATTDSKKFTDTVYVTQNSLKHLVINSEKKVTEKPTAHQITVDVSSSMDFKFAVKDGDDWITPQDAEKTHAKGDNVKIAFNLKENKSIADRSTMLLFATTDSKKFTDTVYVTQNSLKHLVINSEKKVTEKPTAHQISVDVSSSVDFKFAVKDGDDWITPQDAEKTHAKGDNVKIAFNLKENKSLVDRSTVLLFAAADSKEFTDTVYVTQNTLSHLVINSEKKVTEKPTAHQISVDVSSSVDFKFAVKDGDDWITPENAEKTHAKGDNVKIAFNLKENGSGTYRYAKLLFASANSKDFTDTVYVTQNSLSRLVINSEKNVTEFITAHQMTVDVSSNVDFKFAVKDGNDWITPENAEKTHAKGDHIKIAFNLKQNELGADRQAELLFATVDSKDFTDIVHVTQTGVIRVKTPGTLSQELRNAGIEDPLSVKKITIEGTLGGADVLCLRQMSGGGINENEKTNGQLTNLDISQVEFSPDMVTYFIIDKDEQKIRGTDILPDYIFNGIKTLKDIKLPENLTKIGSDAFLNTDLTSIHIPERVTSFDKEAFKGSSLRDINIPTGLTSLGELCFGFCKNLEQVYLPNTVKQIAGHVFYQCRSLIKINIPEDITSIGKGCFTGCAALETLVIPNTMKEIPNQFLFGCHSLKNFTIPESVTSIGNTAFVKCTMLTKIIIPENVKSIGTQAFNGCGKTLSSIIINVKDPKAVTLNDGSFDISEYSTLYVPKDLVKEYQESQFNFFFKNRIKPQD